MDKISIIVPVYNCAGELGRTLDSLLAQSYEYIQIVAVDDGSTDGGWEILTRYAGNHPRILPIRQKNSGVTVARLAGVRAASGDWIGFVDGDDVVDEDMFRRLLENAQKAHADISHCGHAIHFPDGRIEYRHNSGKCYTQDHLRGLRELLDGGQIDSSLCTKLFQKRLFDGIEQWMNPALRNGEDMLMNYYLFAGSGQAVYEDFCPYHYLLRAGSASRGGRIRNKVFDPIQARQQILEQCEDEMKADARIALMRNLLFACAVLSRLPRKETAGLRAEARGLLRQQSRYFPMLSLRNRVLARMICTAPWSFNIAYGCYVSLFQRQEQH